MIDTEQYQAAVAEARTLVKRSEADQWRLAQLTWENAAPFRQDREHNMSEWADAIEVHLSYASRIRQMWEEHRFDIVKPPWSEAYLEVSPSSAYRPSTPEKAAEMVEKLMADPEVAAKVHQRQQEQREQPESKPAPQPQPVDLLSIFNDLAEARRRVRAAFRATVSTDPADNVKFQLLDELGDVETEIEQFRRFLTGIGVEEFIDELMEGAGGAAS